MRHCHRLILLVIALAVCFKMPAQSEEGKATRYYNRAHELYKTGKEERAIEYMKQAIGAYPRLAYTYADLGLWLYKNAQYEEALKWYEQGAKLVPDGALLFALGMSKCALALYDHQKAFTLINRYGNQSAEWKRLLGQANFIRQHYRPNSKDTLQKLSLRINTEGSESFAQVTANNKKLWYTAGALGVNEAIFYASWDSCTNDWYSGKPLPYPVNTPLQNAAATISADEHYLFFMRCDNKSTNGWDNGECDLFMAYTADSVWSTPQSFGGTINSTGFEGMPCLSPDNKALYFSSDKPGGLGGKDIWVSFFEEGKWQRPINLGPTINTSGNETAPFISPDNQTLYFVSDQWPGFGGLDLFRARKTNDTIFTTAENLGYPYNSTANEVSVSVAANGVQAYISSDRQAVLSKYNIYSAKLSERLQPDAVTYVSGYTQDSLTQEHLPLAQLKLTNLRTGNTEYRFVSNRGDGSFMMSLPLYEKFLLETYKRGYKIRYDTLSLNQQNLEQDYVMAIGMLPEDYVPPTTQMQLATFYFEKNATQLDDTVRLALNKFIDQYKDQAGASLVINSYTDNSGTPMLNEQISTLRADAIKTFVLAKGWDADKVKAIGWGETVPVADNQSEEGRNKNRRVELYIEVAY